MALKQRKDDKTRKEYIKFFITITSGVLCLTLFATGEPFCYSLESLDESNGHIKTRSAYFKRVECDDSPKICKRFASKEEVKWVDLLNSHCLSQGDNSPAPTESNEAISCRKDDLPVVTSGYFNCSGYSVGDNCNLTCDDGYYPSSSNKTVCEGTISLEANWTKGTFECSAISCREVDLPVVKSGYFNCSGYFVGDKCNLTCDDGYYPFSSNETVCERTTGLEADWTEDIFECSDCNEWNAGNGLDKWTEYKSFGTTQTWEESIQVCDDEFGYFVVIRNQEVNEFVYKVVQYCIKDDTWIGLNDLDGDGKWGWAGTGCSTGTYSNWGETQPSVNGSRCAYVLPDHEGKWSHLPCNERRACFCERSIS